MSVTIWDWQLRLTSYSLAGLLIVEGDYEQFYCVEHWLISDYTKAKPIAGRCALIAEHLVPRS